jgi:acyl-CoA reductase-like NAD-dependent aldehyde dehydrogenase
MTGLSQDLRVAKTIKLFINGEFPRTESGRSFPVYYAKSKKLYANLCLASRKDFRNAISAARGAQKSWSSKSAYNRGQILYRMAEMAEGRRAELQEVLSDTLGLTTAVAQTQVNAAIDALVYYAGFADKFSQLIGAVNPVSGPHHNFTTPEPVGTVVYIAPEKFDLSQLVRALSAIICSGNSVVAIMQKEGAAILASLAEIFATSDLPKGVLNLLSGDLAELSSHVGSHMEVESVCYDGTNKNVLKELQELAVGNFKRMVPSLEKKNNLSNILAFVEYKTVWHPIGV